MDEFKKRNTEVIGVSVDSKFTHHAWANTPREDGGIKGVNYPLVSDLNKSIARDYGVLLEGPGIALRGLFIINKDGILKHATINHNDLGGTLTKCCAFWTRWITAKSTEKSALPTGRRATRP